MIVPLNVLDACTRVSAPNVQYGKEWLTKALNEDSLTTFDCGATEKLRCRARVARAD